MAFFIFCQMKLDQIAISMGVSEKGVSVVSSPDPYKNSPVFVLKREGRAFYTVT